jgi:16S rRNA (uracil1498-N3)-methyltransferase
MSLSRFFLDRPRWTPGAEQVLDGDEAHHASRVLRLKTGDQTELFDGCGRVARCEIRHLSKQDLHLQILEDSQHPPLPHRIHLLPALIKGESFDWLLEKAVELGAASFHPLLTANTVVHWDSSAWSKKRDKWHKQMLAAAKQCHTPWLPELRQPIQLAAKLRELTEATAPGSGITSANTSPKDLRLIPALIPGAAPLQQVLQAWRGPREAWILIGPEGDFTASEVAQATAADFTPVTLGPLILRAETAAIASLACVSQAWYV